jgi:DNA-binding transcriptional MerR regulator/effector-binding domain-containing protein
MFTIGAFSRLCGVSRKALRAYDALGLFRPAWVDAESGYRRYSPAQLPEIRRIAALRSMGMSLPEIGASLRGGGLREALAARRAALERERAEVDRRLAELDIRVEAAAETRVSGRGVDADHGADVAGGPDGLDVVVRNLEREPVATLSLELVEGGDPELGYDELEAVVRDAGVRAHRPPGMVLEPRASTLYVPVRRAVGASERIGNLVLPATRAATILHRGGYEGLTGRSRELEAWVGRAGLAPAGALRILYLQFGADPMLRLPSGWVVERSADFLTELQLPVG